MFVRQKPHPPLSECLHTSQPQASQTELKYQQHRKQRKPRCSQSIPLKIGESLSEGSFKVIVNNKNVGYLFIK